MAQHLTGVKIAAEFCQARTKGLRLHSTTLEFYPGEFRFPTYKKIDIGTAGSIGLLLQTLTPMLIFADRVVTLEIIGGTAGLGAPPIEYLSHITYPNLAKIGLPLPEIEIIKQGFYPKGQGRIKIVFNPTQTLHSINITSAGKVKHIKGISVCGNLPEHVAKRQASSAEVILKRKFNSVEIIAEAVSTASPGSSITLWADCTDAILGADALGKRGISAEAVGRMAALSLIESIESEAAFDKHMADQIIPFLGLAKGESKIKVEKVTQHVWTNIAVTEKLLETSFEILDRTITVNGIGFEH
jgi:RNA 3'-terminal phosphate cyclase (ATP)